LTGLGWEHVSTALAPADGARWSAVTFDTKTYGVRQDPTSMAPFAAEIAARTVVFDIPYFDLSLAPSVRGVTNWGAHDPGVVARARPDELQEELHRRFPYPAEKWIYSFTWPSAERTREMGAALVGAVRTRAKAAHWLLAERLPDWDLAMVAAGESHSAIEPLWHGVDARHPLHGIASAQPASEVIREIYRATDDLVGELLGAFPDATAVLFAMHGMGSNDADVATMALLPELLFRHAFGRAYLRPLAWPRVLPDGTPLLDENDRWETVMEKAVPRRRNGWAGPLRRLLGLDPPKVAADFTSAADFSPLDWMPAARYRTFWHNMPAFALPAFYDGRIRINLRGRESLGKVSREQYDSVCGQIVERIRECRNAQTGESVVDAIHWGEKDPMLVDPSEADIYVIWKSSPLGLTSPTLGTIGPLPYRRTGGHTGAHGFMFIAGEGVTPRDAGTASSFDVIPTVLDLLGERPLHKASGRSHADDICAV
jgi:predicted AlkP superfamily phosphohydrolase/phosphomutase